MREQNSPSAEEMNYVSLRIQKIPIAYLRCAQPIVEIDFANRCVGNEVRENVSDIHDGFR